MLKKTWGRYQQIPRNEVFLFKKKYGGSLKAKIVFFPLILIQVLKLSFLSLFFLVELQFIQLECFLKTLSQLRSKFWFNSAEFWPNSAKIPSNCKFCSKIVKIDAITYKNSWNRTKSGFNSTPKKLYYQGHLR